MTDASNVRYSGVILEHYRKEAQVYGKDASSTMRDEVTRGREVGGVLSVLEWLGRRGIPMSSLLDIGCGNGFLLDVIREKYPSLALTGLEYTPEMVAIALERKVKGCDVARGDVRSLPFDSATWDVVVTERCIINVMDRDAQATSLREVARVLKKGGHFLCIEAFQNSLDALNEARAELGLPPNEVPYHNLWFDEAWFRDAIAPSFDVVDVGGDDEPSLPARNFLSTHYFMSRVVYPAITKREILYNTHFVKFFAMMPAIGNYSPIQFHILRRK